MDSSSRVMFYFEYLHYENFFFFKVWETELLPREVLDLLETKGYNVVSTTGIGQTYVVTLRKPLND